MTEQKRDPLIDCVAESLRYKGADRDILASRAVASAEKVADLDVMREWLRGREADIPHEIAISIGDLILTLGGYHAR